MIAQSTNLVFYCFCWRTGSQYHHPGYKGARGFYFPSQWFNSARRFLVSSGGAGVDLRTVSYSEHHSEEGQSIDYVYFQSFPLTSRFASHVWSDN